MRQRRRIRRYEAQDIAQVIAQVVNVSVICANNDVTECEDECLGKRESGVKLGLPALVLRLHAQPYTQLHTRPCIQLLASSSVKTAEGEGNLEGAEFVFLLRPNRLPNYNAPSLADVAAEIVSLRLLPPSRQAPTTLLFLAHYASSPFLGIYRASNPPAILHQLLRGTYSAETPDGTPCDPSDELTSKVLALDLALVRFIDPVSLVQSGVSEHSLRSLAVYPRVIHLPFYRPHSPANPATNPSAPNGIVVVAMRGMNTNTPLYLTTTDGIVASIEQRPFARIRWTPIRWQRAETEKNHRLCKPVIVQDVALQNTTTCSSSSQSMFSSQSISPSAASLNAPPPNPAPRLYLLVLSDFEGNEGEEQKTMTDTKADTAKTKPVGTGAWIAYAPLVNGRADDGLHWVTLHASWPTVQGEAAQTTATVRSDVDMLLSLAHLAELVRGMRSGRYLVDAVDVLPLASRLPSKPNAFLVLVNVYERKHDAKDEAEEVTDTTFDEVHTRILYGECSDSEGDAVCAILASSAPLRQSIDLERIEVEAVMSETMSE